MPKALVSVTMMQHIWKYEIDVNHQNLQLVTPQWVWSCMNRASTVVWTAHPCPLQGAFLERGELQCLITLCPVYPSEQILDTHLGGSYSFTRPFSCTEDAIVLGWLFDEMISLSAGTWALVWEALPAHDFGRPYVCIPSKTACLSI